MQLYNNFISFNNATSNSLIKHFKPFLALILSFSLARLKLALCRNAV